MENQFLRIKELMAEKGVTGKELAESLGINAVSLSRIISGTNQPRFELLSKIASELGVEMGDLFKSRDQMPLYIRTQDGLKSIGTINKSVISDEHIK